LEDKTIQARDKAFSLEPTKVWKVRQKKSYADAHNHIYLGEVISENSKYVTMKCLTFHFGKKIDSVGKKDIVTGMYRVRRIPWSQIEVIHDIHSDFDFIHAKLVIDSDGTAVLRDEKSKKDCIITKRTDRIN
jgi:hypothetical protein